MDGPAYVYVCVSPGGLGDDDGGDECVYSIYPVTWSRWGGNGELKPGTINDTGGCRGGRPGRFRGLRCAGMCLGE